MNKIIRVTEGKALRRLTIAEICNALTQEMPSATLDVFIIYQRLDGTIRFATETDSDQADAVSRCENCDIEKKQRHLTAGLCKSCQEDAKHAFEPVLKKRKMKSGLSAIRALSPEERAILRKRLGIGR